jgi:hypothetical protein
MGEPADAELATEPRPGDIELLEQRLYRFNVGLTAIDDGQQLAAFLRDGDGMVLGGLRLDLGSHLLRPLPLRPRANARAAAGVAPHGHRWGRGQSARLQADRP